MRPILLLFVLLLTVSACGPAVPDASKKPTPLASATSAPGAIRDHTPVIDPTRRPSTPVLRSTSIPATPVRAVSLSGSYRAFLHSVCAALSSRDTATLRNALPYFQYNSGLRYGVLGDGEGQTTDPSAFDAWLASSHVRCTSFTPDLAGHGTVLASGWVRAPGAWCLIEFDMFNGSWKMNDLTFGSESALHAAMQTSHPILVYRG